MIARSFIRPEVADINAVMQHTVDEYKREDKKRGKKK
jgi:hypothetical protein